jgi:hypothetical protein
MHGRREIAMQTCHEDASTQPTTAAKCHQIHADSMGETVGIIMSKKTIRMKLKTLITHLLPTGCAFNTQVSQFWRQLQQILQQQYRVNNKTFNFKTTVKQTTLSTCSQKV